MSRDNADKQITISINGQPHELDAETTIAQLIQQLGLGDAAVAVERNREVVSHKLFDQTHIAEGDALEIVTLVGGG